MLRISARQWAITVLAIFTTASFWVWAHGQDGAMGTDGVVIALAATVEEDTTAELGVPPTAGVQAVGSHVAAPTQTANPLMVAPPGLLQIMANRTPRLPAMRRHMVVGDNLAAAEAPRTVAEGKHTVVNPMVGAPPSNR